MPKQSHSCSGLLMSFPSELQYLSAFSEYDFVQVVDEFSLPGIKNIVKLFHF